ncbi:PREDICTED: uncharacterized protein At5g03900, chloroplastic-like isoform X2 [Nicotiana attenuata]|uniref:Uncharacterized protein, chloroplastic n=1 Tax=Nicotiana attenuata TaxID=49451 RepID=A0A314KH19_NICAT|nr:PREDICTED: uncharacterized protein At5g03900, chloroplastic-like isoform X2 [Nicotiana attenuata]OIT28606.1 uncharacterized protein, chloroplastic [Nicotiana attenuata]
MAAIYSKSFFTMKQLKVQSFNFESFKFITITYGSLRYNKKTNGSSRTKLILSYSRSLVESDQLRWDVRKRAMDAIESLGRRVTVGDLASKAGLQLSEAQIALQSLATDTNGFLEVSDEGDVLYVFPEGYRSNLAAKSFRIKVEPLLEKAKMAAEYLVRVSFGTTLIASIVIVYTAIIAIALSRGDDDISFPDIGLNNKGRRTTSYDSGLFWCWDPNYHRRRRIHKDGVRMNFFGSVFSFVFGDADPNQGIDEERWKLIGQYILSNGGVVVAEELAPFLDLKNPNYMDDESYILPVLLQFDGQPEVDKEGNILYRFPSLQRTAARQWSGRKEFVGKIWPNWDGQVEKYLKEIKWQFSKASVSQAALVVGLGVLNLLGVIILGTMLRSMTVSPSSFISSVSKLFPLLQIYAGSFFTIPFVRWLLVRKRNSEIEKRNQAREQYAQALERPDFSLRRKLLSARDMAQRTFIGQNRIVYSTNKDLYEQDYDAQQWEQGFGIGHQVMRCAPASITEASKLQMDQLLCHFVYSICLGKEFIHPKYNRF